MARIANRFSIVGVLIGLLAPIHRDLLESTVERTRAPVIGLLLTVWLAVVIWSLTSAFSRSPASLFLRNLLNDRDKRSDALFGILVASVVFTLVAPPLLNRSFTLPASRIEYWTVTYNGPRPLDWIERLRSLGSPAHTRRYPSKNRVLVLEKGAQNVSWGYLSHDDAVARFQPGDVIRVRFRLGRLGLRFVESIEPINVSHGSS